MKAIYGLITITLFMLTNAQALAADAKHLPGIFLGYTHAEHETEFTYGFEYEYKFNNEWGLGAIYEKISDAHHGDGITITLGEVFYHTPQHIRLGVGFGKEKVGGHHPHSEDLYRVSASYGYHIGDFILEPTFAVDFVNSEKAYVFGVAFVRAF